MIGGKTDDTWECLRNQDSHKCARTANYFLYMIETNDREKTSVGNKLNELTVMYDRLWPNRTVNEMYVHLLPSLFAHVRFK